MIWKWFGKDLEIVTSTEDTYAHTEVVLGPGPGPGPGPHCGGKLLQGRGPGTRARACDVEFRR